MDICKKPLFSLLQVLYKTMRWDALTWALSRERKQEDQPLNRAHSSRKTWRNEKQLPKKTEKNGSEIEELPPPTSTTKTEL